MTTLETVNCETDGFLSACSKKEADQLMNDVSICHAADLFTTLQLTATTLMLVSLEDWANFKTRNHFSLYSEIGNFLLSYRKRSYCPELWFNNTTEAGKTLTKQLEMAAVESIGVIKVTVDSTTTSISPVGGSLRGAQTQLFGFLLRNKDNINSFLGDSE